MQINYFKKFSFLLLMLIIILLCFIIYFNWQTIITYTFKFQKELNLLLTSHLKQTNITPIKSGIGLILISFLYGILHSAGPGHGKIIISTYLTSNKTELKRSLALTFLAALLQGFVAISVVSLVILLLKSTTKILNLSVYYLELISFLMIIVLGTGLLIKSLTKIIKKNTVSNHNNCHCNTHNLQNTKEIFKKNIKSELGVILSIGLRPCSGAILILIFSASIGGYWFGILATFAISLGTTITTSLFAMISYYAREKALRYIKKMNDKNHWLSDINYYLAIFSGLILIFIGVICLITIMNEPATLNNPLLKR